MSEQYQEIQVIRAFHILREKCVVRKTVIHTGYTQLAAIIKQHPLSYSIEQFNAMFIHGLPYACLVAHIVVAKNRICSPIGFNCGKGFEKHIDGINIRHIIAAQQQQLR